MTNRQLNRALLARQMLLKREQAAIPETLKRIGSLQAQMSRPPYVALWSRIEGFERSALTRLFQERVLVKATSNRGTLHILSGKDYLAWRASFAEMFQASFSAVGKGRLEGLDADAVVKYAAKLFGQRPRRFEEMREELSAPFPDADYRMLGYCARMLLPLVVVPESEEWGYVIDGQFTPAESWLGGKLETKPRLEELVLRYLGAFGPAVPADAQRWLGLGGLRQVFEKLGDQLIQVKDERGRTLFDLPSAPRPEEDIPAPARYLGEFDNVLLAHDDRARIVPEAAKPKLASRNLQIPATFLVDGFVAGTWKSTRTKKAARLRLEPFRKLKKVEKDDLEAEGKRLLQFLDPELSQRSVEFEA